VRMWGRGSKGAPAVSDRERGEGWLRMVLQEEVRYTENKRAYPKAGNELGGEDSKAAETASW